MYAKIVKSDPRAREKPCLRCGYSLRKLTDSRHCPECGLSIWLSLNNNDALEWSSPAWLRKLSVATWALCAAQVMGIVAYAIFLFELPLYWMMLLFTGLYLLTHHSGMLLLSVHEQRYPDRLSGYRLALRIIGVAGIALGALLLFRLGSRMWSMRLSTLVLMRIIIEGVIAAGAIGTFACLRRLARRIPNSTIARICGYILLAPLLSFAKAMPILSLILATHLSWLLRWLPIVYLPVALGLFIWFAIQFRKNADAAAQNWQAESAAGVMV